MKRILALCAVALMLAMAGCSDKTPATLDDFKGAMEQAGYHIVDASGQFDKSIAESVTVAVKDSGQVEFFLLTSEDNAAASFETNKSKLEAKSGGVRSSVSAGNYAFYNLTKDGIYYSVSRVGETMIYAEAPEAQKDEVSERVDSLGY